MLSHLACGLLESLVSQESYYFPWRGSRCTSDFMANSDLVLVVAFIYGSWDVGLFLCRLVFVAICCFRLIEFLFSFLSIFLYVSIQMYSFLGVTFRGTFLLIYQYHFSF